MPKKRTAPKRKPVKGTITEPESFDISIPTEEPTVSFSLGEEKIEGTVVLFHRLAMQAQAEAFNERNELVDYMPEYAALLNKEFALELVITPEIAYRIFDPVLNLFHQLKKKPDQS